MTSFLEVIASNQDDERKAARKAAVLSKTRIENTFGSFLATYGDEGVDHLKDEITSVVEAACEEVGYSDVEGTLAVVIADTNSKIADADEDHAGCGRCGHYPTPKPGESCPECGYSGGSKEDPVWGAEAKTASIHESRKPKMCPYHKDVVDISLAQGEPRAGFDAMGQHWGGPKHCEGDDYAGGKCNFKSQMTTQAFWDDKAEKAEQRKLERQEQAELEAQQPITESPTESVEDASPVDDISTESEGAEIIDFPSPEPSAVGEGIDTTPEALVAAKVAERFDDSKPYTPDHEDDCAICGKEFPRGELAWHGDQLECAYCEDARLHGPGTDNYRKHVVESPRHAADSNPVPKIDKRKWTPKTVPQPELEGSESRNPTKRVDIAAEGYSNTPKELSEIGENKTERVNLPSSDNAGFSDGGEVGEGQGGTWTDGPKSAVAAHDPEKNELVEIMRNNYDGFLPQADVEMAVVSYRRK